MPKHPAVVPASHKNLYRAAALTVAVMASTSLTGTVWAQEFPAIQPLAALNGINGKRFDGGALGERVGNVVSSNPKKGTAQQLIDDTSDLVVAAAFYYGSNNLKKLLTLSFKDLGADPVVSISSLSPDQATQFNNTPTSTPAAGSTPIDFNGDGRPDILIGEGGLNGIFLVFVQFNPPGPSPRAPAVFDLSTLNGTNGIRLETTTFESTGAAVSGAGDVNGDGFGDLIIGAPKADRDGPNSGSSYVVFGRAPPFASVINLSTLNGSNGFRLDGEVSGPYAHYSGSSVAGAGDINRDGFGDLIIGAPSASPNGNASGSSYVIFGKAAPFQPAIKLSTLNGATGFRLDGASSFNFTGESVAGAGDVNGDGFDDIAVGGHGVDGNGSQSGASYVVFGKASAFTPVVNLSSLTGSNGFRLDGTSFSYSGKSVSGGGDVNGDGFDDIISGGYQGNRSFVLFGKAAGFTATINPSTLNGANGFRLDGVTAGDQSGFSVSTGGDMNGDGFDDLMVGAPRADPNGVNDAGSAFTILGRAPNSPRVRVGSIAHQYISGGAFGDTLRGLGGHDRLEGRGGGDVLDGGNGLDTATYRHAPAGLTADLETPGNNTGQATGDSFVSIENLTGSPRADRLFGNQLANRLTGGLGPDLLTGRNGSDIYAYSSVAESPPGVGRDRIDGFDAGGPTTVVDRIDLRAIDANRNLPGDQAFTYRGTLAFSAAGQIRVQTSGGQTIISGDVDGDAVADLQIVLLGFTNLANLTGFDFIR